MTTTVGKSGYVKLGGEGSANIIAEVTGYSLTVNHEPVEDTEMSDDDRTFKAGKSQWTGRVSCHWDGSDTNGQVTLIEGASVTLGFYPEGDGSGDNYREGTAIVTTVEESAERDGLVEATFNFQGSGALTRSTVSP